MKRLLLALLLIPRLSLPDTIPGQALIDFEVASNGTVVTPSLMLNATKGQTWNGWQTLSNPEARVVGSTPSLMFSSAASYQLFTPADINGTVYPGTGSLGMRAIMDRNNAVQLKLPSSGYQLSVGFYFRFNGQHINWSPRDVFGMYSDPTGNYQMLQIYDGTQPYFNAHWQPGGSGVGNEVNFNRNQWYWVTMCHVAGGGTMKISFYDPARDYALVGTSSGYVSSGTVGCNQIQFGCIKYSFGASQSVDFDNIIINTNGVFPLGPGNGGAMPNNKVPIAVSSATPTMGVAPLTVGFSAEGSSDPDGTPLQFAWSFGDGESSTVKNPSYTFVSPGTYSVGLSVTDGFQTSHAQPITITVSGSGVNQPPAAGASASPTNGAAPLSVNFSSVDSSDPEGASLTYNWIFGDGASATTANPTHTYSAPGTYTARLTVSDGTNYASSANVSISVVAKGAGLVASYNFDEGSGSAVSDGSGNNNTGTISGAAWTAGKSGKALSFDGSSVVTIPDSPSLRSVNGLTVAAWVYPTSAGTEWSPIVFKPLNASQISFVLQGASPPSGAPSFHVLPSTVNVYGTAAIPLNTWSHLAATYDGATMRLYINGTEVGNKAQTGTLNYSTEALTIGGNPLYQAFWRGAIDEVRIYNRALAASEIQMDIEKVAKPSSPQNLRIVSP